MQNKILSVVIPTYNMEAYLRRCLDSVTRSDVPNTLEIIVVNDGSTDSSLSIMQEYANKRPDIVNIINKPNGHYGSCVNAALKVATGKYFRILDADDWFDTEALIKFLNQLQATETDIIVTPYCVHRHTQTYTIRPQGIVFTNKYSANDEYVWKRQQSNLYAMHAFTYKTNVLKDVNLKLTEGICYTDTEYLLYPLQKAKDISFFNIVLYHYDWTRDGQSMTPEVYTKNHSHLAKIVTRFFKDFDQTLFTQLSKRIFLDVLVKYYYRMLFCCIDDAELKKIDSIVKKLGIKANYCLNKKLFGSLFLWRLTRAHFLFYEKIKKALHIER
jgi:glycosyltransferase involved in cell wall biosynthesis